MKRKLSNCRNNMAELFCINVVEMIDDDDDEF